ncbi:hypothetical protein GWI34_26755 [Actinomadura sp. DSM 109109]|nr:hypothetical protein [Actinomadura lepetitiana]
MAANNGNDNAEACPADLPENGGASETSPVVHVVTSTGSGSNTTVKTDGPKPTH